MSLEQLLLPFAPGLLSLGQHQGQRRSCSELGHPKELQRNPSNHRNIWKREPDPKHDPKHDPNVGVEEICKCHRPGSSQSRGNPNPCGFQSSQRPQEPPRSPHTDPSLTIRVLLAGVGDQPAVVGAGGPQIWDAIVVVVLVTLVPQPVVVRVQLGAVGHCGAVIPGILVPVAVAADTGTGTRYPRPPARKTFPGAGILGRSSRIGDFGLKGICHTKNRSGIFLLECVGTSGNGPYFQWSLFWKSEDNSTSKPSFFNGIRPGQVVTVLFPLHPQDFIQINRILNFCSKVSPVLVGVTDISHQIVVGVSLEK